MAMVDPLTADWTADREALTLAIRAGWSEVEVDSTPRSAACSFRGSFETEGSVGEAYLHEGGTCLYLDTSLVDAVRLAVAFRRLVPDDVEVVFCDQG
jgi:hypothetical protein